MTALHDLSQPAKNWLADAIQNLGGLLGDGKDPSFSLDIGGAEFEFRLIKLPGEFERVCVELSGTASGWIATAERLPDDDMVVLIALTDGEVWTGFHDGDHGWRYVSADLVGAEVRYWRERPEHPEALRNAAKGTAP